MEKRCCMESLMEKRWCHWSVTVINNITSNNFLAKFHFEFSTLELNLACSPLQRTFHEDNPTMLAGVQHDAHECLVNLLDGVVSAVGSQKHPFKWAPLMLLFRTANNFSKHFLCYNNCFTGRAMDTTKRFSSKYEKMRKMQQGSFKMLM